MKKEKKRALKDRTIAPFEARLDERAYTVDVLRDAAIGTDIDREMDRQPSLFMWYVALAEDASDKWRRAKKTLDDMGEDLKSLRGDVFSELVSSFEKKEERVPGVDKLNVMVDCDPRVREAAQKLRKQGDKLLDAQLLAGKLHGFVKGFEQRFGMIQSKTKLRTAEMERLDLTTRGKAATRRVREKDED